MANAKRPVQLKTNPDVTMIIEKTFHLNESIQAAKTRLSNIGSFRRHLAGMKKAYVTADGVGHFEFETGAGFRGHVDVAEVASDNPDQTLFKSYDGNIDLVGVVEYFAIRPNLTEVTLTIDYKIKSPMFRVIDLLTGTMDRFLNRQLRNMQRYFLSRARAKAAMRFDSYVPMDAGFEQTPRFV
jgi:carbon monoxide dehydrogenase subunit G